MNRIQLHLLTLSHLFRTKGWIQLESKYLLYDVQEVSFGCLIIRCFQIYRLKKEQETGNWSECFDELMHRISYTC